MDAIHSSVDEPGMRIMESRDESQRRQTKIGARAAAVNDLVDVLSIGTVNIGARYSISMREVLLHQCVDSRQRCDRVESGSSVVSNPVATADTSSMAMASACSFKTSS